MYIIGIGECHQFDTKGLIWSKSECISKKNTSTGAQPSSLGILGTTIESCGPLYENIGSVRLPGQSDCFWLPE